MSAIFAVLSGAAESAMAAMLPVLDYASVGAQWVGEGATSRGGAAGGGGVGLGFRRTPGTAGVGLHFDREAGLALAAHIRLDDREGLGAALGLNCGQCAGLADGDLVLHSYRRWGMDAPGRLVGDYAFALWDGRRRTLLCARDHIGVQPFYYAFTAKAFVGAGSLDAVLAAPGVSDELDEAMVAAWLTRVGLEENSRTLFKEVRKLPPGHSLTVRCGVADAAPRVYLRRHWRPEDAPPVRRAKDADYAAEFLALCESAVQVRLPDSGSVGAHLSGGLDSSAVTVLAARELRRRGRRPPLAFSWLPNLGGMRPSEAQAGEYAPIEAVCRQEGLQVLHCAPSPDDWVAMLRRDGARPGVHIHPNEEAVQRCAQERGVPVLLSGWGGDEGASFNGRGHRAQLLLCGRWAELLAAGRVRGRNPLRFAAEVALPLLTGRLLLDLQLRRRYGEPWHRRWLAHPKLLRRHGVKPRRFSRFVGTRRTQLRLLQGGHLSERMEGWAADGARRGIEYRYPLLDQRLLEFTLGLPPEQFLRGKWSRWLMRHAMQGVLPSHLCWSIDAADPTRYGACLESFTDALPALRRLLEAPEAPLSSRYIDMPRLLERMDPARFRAQPLFESLRKALQFLDF